MSIHEWHNETVGKRVVEALKKNNFDAVYCACREEAVQRVLEFISPGAKVGVGGSMTVQELGLLEKIAEKGATILNHNQPGLTPEQKLEIRRQQLVSDVFLTSTNALTMDGYLVNVDGSGNRVAAMTFGPKKIVIVAGINKIVPDINAAFNRIKTLASPKNNKRLNLPNPCTTTGVCMDCESKSRICNVYTVMKKKPLSSDITVIVVGDTLGY